MKRRAVKADEDHKYYGHSWWRVSPVRMGCVIAIIILLAVGLPIAYKKWLAPTWAMTKLNNEETPKKEKLAALRLIREAGYAAAFLAVQSRLKDEEEDLAVRGEAARTIAVFGNRAQKSLREVFESSAPVELKMEILHHLNESARDLIELEASSPTDEELRDACQEWLDMHPE